MIKFLFLFMDGVGLGKKDPASNPFVKAKMPQLNALLDGRRLVASSAPLKTERASLLAIDPNLGVSGLPQSATGQAALLTGINVPAAIGEHYGPKPNQPVRDQLAQGTIFSQLTNAGHKAALLNAYPDGYFSGVNSGKRLYSAIPQAVVNAGLALKTAADFEAEQALSADFTGEGWRKHLKVDHTPLYTPEQAGAQLTKLTVEQDFAFFEYWPSDYAGHRQNKSAAVALLEAFDGVLEGLLKTWDDQQGLILITSDHGNLEDIATRRHTANPVPALVIGAPELRMRFCDNLHTLADVAPAILQFYSQGT
ncbi:MAG: metalloenzyme domain-containing protein [Chloroflexota bacterium]